jgi:hypothetical protein
MSSTVIIEAMVASSGLILLRFVVVVMVMVVVVVVVVVVDTVADDLGCSSLPAVEEVKKAETEEESCSSKLPGMIMLPLPLTLPLPLPLPLPLALPPLPLLLVMLLSLSEERLEEALIVDPSSCINVERVSERVAICHPVRLPLPLLVPLPLTLLPLLPLLPMPCEEEEVDLIVAIDRSMIQKMNLIFVPR